MKTKILIRNIIFLFVSAVIIGTIFPGHISADDAVVFECDNLRLAMQEIIGYEDITIEDMESLEGAVDLSYKNIFDISGLEHLTNVEDLDLSYNNISDITPVISLANIKSLYLDDNWIKELPDTQTNLVSLEHLDISGNEIQSVPSAFIDMPSLRRLYMGNLSVTAAPDLSPVSDTLDRLDVSGCRFDDFGFVEKLYNLELLDMSDCDISQLPDISNLGNLGYLYLADNSISSLPDYLGYLPLIRLDFSSNEVSALPDSFANLTKIEQLVFTDNSFRVLPDVVTKMYTLQVLMCGQNMISDVPDNMGDLENIKRASFASNQLTTLNKFYDFNIPYSYQISFDLNYLDLADENNIEILQDYRNDGGKQRAYRLEAETVSADTQSVVIKCGINQEEMNILGKNVVPLELKLYKIENNDISLVNKTDISESIDMTFEIADKTNLSEGYASYIVCLVLEDTSWPSVKIKYTAVIENIQIIPAVTQEPQTPEITVSPTPQITAVPAAQPQENKLNYLLYVLIFGVIMIITSVVLFAAKRKKTTIKRRRSN